MTDLKRLVDDSTESEVERRLLESALGDSPPEGAKARLRGAMGLPPLEPPPVTQPPSSVFTTVKWVGLAALLIVGAAAVRGVMTEPTRVAAPLAPLAPPTAPPPEPAPTPSVAEVVPSAEPVIVAPLLAPSSVPSAPSTPAIVAQPSSSAAAAKPLSLRAELELLDAIRTDLASGRSASALQKLDRHDREFARGALVDEASVLRVEALLAHGEKARAEAFASRFLASHRGTPYEARIRTLLATP